MAIRILTIARCSRLPVRPARDPNVRCTKYGNFLLSPVAGLPWVPIPRNYGERPGNFSVNLRMSRTWGFGEVRTSAPGGTSSGGDHGGPGGGGPRAVVGLAAAADSQAAVAAEGVAAAAECAAARPPTSATT